MNARLEAFCDAVFAFALTLLIVDVRMPEETNIHGAAEAWASLGPLGPSFFAFLLSFAVILITWVNHHNTLKLVKGSSPSFIYANGLLLLGVVCIPFTTELLGLSILTDHAEPGVVLYDAVLVLQALGWLAVARTVLRDGLATSDHGARTIRERSNGAYGAIALYSGLALLGVWFPLVAASITTVTWLLWLGMSLRSPRINEESHAH
jgi:uncharacterized membrane protein